MFLQTEDAESVRSGALIKAVVKALQSTFHPAQVIKGGSAGKNTDVPGSDIDLVVILHDYDYKQLASYRSLALQELQASADITDVNIKREIKVGITVFVRTVADGRSVDILFTGDPDMNPGDNPLFCYDCFFALDQCKYVKQMKAKYPLLHEIIIRFKVAAFEQRKGVDDIKCPSYFIELLIIKDFEETPARLQYERSYCDAKPFKENGQAAEPATVARRQRGVYELSCPVTGVILDIPEGKSRDWWNVLRL